MANTGGVAVPSPVKTPVAPGRKAAAVVALGGPKGVTRAPKADVNARMPKAAKAPTKMPGQAKAGKAPKATPAKPTRTVFNPVEGVLGSKEIRNISHTMAQEVLKAELEPLKSEAKEVANNETGASQRYSQYSTAANNLLAGVAGSQEASAKTFENQAADNALQAGKAIETSGQTQASMTGGYVSPELRAQLNAEAAREVGAGAAGNTFAQNTAQAGQNLVAGLRGAAALRAVEGQGKITGYFQKEANKIGEAENTRIAKVGADQAKDETELGQKNVTDYATLQGLGIKQSELLNKTGLDTSKEKEERSKEVTEASKRQDERSKENSEGVKNRVSLAKLGIEGEKEQATQKHYEAENKENEASAKEKLAKVANGGVTTDTELKLLGEVASAYGTVEMLRSQGAKSASPQQIRQFIHIGADVEAGKSKVKVKAISNPALVNAAIELYYYHTVSPATQAALKAAGIDRTPAELATSVGV
jgi:hypothetical protein